MFLQQAAIWLVPIGQISLLVILVLARWLQSVKDARNGFSVAAKV
jgi:hypothetical protein